MKDLVSLYKSGSLKGSISEDQILDIWSEIKKDAPSLLNTLNQLSEGKTFSESELVSFEEKINIYSKLTNHLCKFHLRQEVGYFDQDLNHFLQSVINKNKTDLSFSTLAITNEYVLIDNHKVVFKTKGISLFHILCKILFKKKEDLSLFLYYLALKDQNEASNTIKKFWTINLYLLSKIK